MKTLRYFLACISILIFLFGCGPSKKEIAREDEKMENNIAKLECDSTLIISSWGHADLNNHFFDKIDIGEDTITFGTHNYAISRFDGLSNFKLNNKQTDSDGYYLIVGLSTYTGSMGSYTYKRMGIQKICREQ